MSKEERNFIKLNNLKSTNIHYSTIIKQCVSMLNKTSRTVPNILKSSSRSHRFSKVDATKLNCSFKDVTNTEQHVPVLFVPNAVPEHTFIENTLVKKEVQQHKPVSRRRKQELRFADIWHELPNWSICSFVDDKKKMPDKEYYITTESESSAERKKLNRYIKKRNKKQTIPVLKNEEEDYSPSMSQTVFTQNDCTSECQVFPFLQENESNDLQDTIDFSSNEIFSKFNYEFFNNNSDCFTWYLMNSDKTCNSLNTKHNSNNYEEYDINDNEDDTCETATNWSLTDNEQIEKDSSTEKSIMFSQYSSETLSSFSDKISKCSSNSCCDNCFDDCVSNWITASETNDFTKNKLLTDTFNEVPQIELNSSQLDISKDDTYLSDNASLEYGSKRLYSSISETESCFQIINDTSLTESYGDEKDIEAELFEQSTYMKQQDEYNISMEDLYDIGTEQIEDNNEHNTNENESQCLLCPLTFPNARTMAMHQSAAHGGMYIILCESCGRLFNQKYHFNRHFIHCHRVNDAFKCNMCMRKYRHKSSLIHHLKVAHHVYHNRNRSTTFACGVCNKSYRKFGAYKNHVRKHA